MAKLLVLIACCLAFIACANAKVHVSTVRSAVLAKSSGTEVKDAIGDFLDFLTQLTGVDVRALIVQWPKSIVGIMAAMDYANQAYTSLLIESQLLPRLNSIINTAAINAQAASAKVLEIVGKILNGTATGLDWVELSVVIGPTLSKLQVILVDAVSATNVLVDELMASYRGRILEILNQTLTEIWAQLKPLADILRPLLPGLPGQMVKRM